MLTVILPVYNEQHDLQHMCDELIHEFSDIPNFEIIIINDGSDDQKCLNMLSEIEGQKEHIIRVISNTKNRGYGFSLKKGIESAGNEVIAFLDCDNSYSVKDLKSLYLRYMKTNCDMAVGNRVGKYYMGNASKRFLRLALRMLAEYISQDKIQDINSGIRVIKKYKFRAFLPLASDRFSFTTSLTLIATLKKFEIEEIFVDYRKRVGSSHVRLFRDGLTTVGQIFALSAFFNPLRVAFLFFQIFLTTFALITIFDYLLKANLVLAYLGTFVLFFIIYIGLFAHMVKDHLLLLYQKISND